MSRFVVMIALAGMTVTVPRRPRGEGSPMHLYGSWQSQPVSRAGIPTPFLSPSDLLAGCGRGRYRDPATHKCRGPADVQ